MEIKDLKPADILLFEGDRSSWLSKAIMLLTDSDVSHAAMSYTESGKVVEQSPPAVRVADIAPRLETRKVYVMRRDEAPPMEPVLDAATGYLNDEEPYAMSSLILVGLLLIYKKFSPDGLMQKAMLKIFKALSSSIIDWINARKNPGDLPSVCSQFVYQCYQDAGAGYRLQIKDGVLVPRTRGALAAEAAGSLSLLDQAIDTIRSDRAHSFHKFATANVESLTAVPEKPQSEEELARELVEALEQLSPTDGEALVDPELALAVQGFGEAVWAASSGATEFGTTEMLRSSAARLPSAGLSLLKTEQAYFITPADLLNSCVNAKRVGVLGPTGG